MKSVYAILILALAGCSHTPVPIQKCPIQPPDAPEIWEEARLPDTEIQLQKEFLRLKSAYEESLEAEQAWRDLWNQC